jgi:hypothetical protein
MALRFYQNSLDNGMSLQPNDDYRQLQQAFMDQAWDNTSARRVIEEQDDFGPLTFHDIDVWLNFVVGTTTTFMKNGADYCQILFQDIERQVIRGLYYKFDDNYWISDFTNPYQGLVSDVTLRRCNNYLRIIDPENGNLFQIPCVVDYDMSSPQVQISSYIITPNNHATVYVQANSDTIRLFKLNTRYILNGRPFKLNAFQNALNTGIDEPVPTVLYLDLYLDEIHVYDDLVNQVAYNGDFDYKINILSDKIELPRESTGRIEYKVSLNGEEINKPVVFTSSDTDVIIVDVLGKFKIFGQEGTTATVTVALADNPEIKDEISVIVTETATGVPNVVLTPDINKIRQYETISVKLGIEFNGTIYKADNVIITSITGDNISVSLTGDILELTGISVSKIPVRISLNLVNEEQGINFVHTIYLTCVSMLG